MPRLICSPMTASIAAASLAGLAGCSTIDASKPMITPFATATEALGTKNQVSASYLRKELRRSILLKDLAFAFGGATPLGYDWPTKVEDQTPESSFLCGVLQGALDDRHALATLSQFSAGLKVLTADSPTTLVELIAAAGRDYGDVWTQPPADEGRTNAAFTASCQHDLLAASLVTESPYAVGSSYGAAGALFGLIKVFEELIRPVLIQGATVLDRQRRAEALKNHFAGNEGAARFNSLMESIERLRTVAVNQSRVARMLAASDVLTSRDALKAAERLKATANAKLKADIVRDQALLAAEKDPKKRAPLQEAINANQTRYEQALGGCDADPVRRMTTTLVLPGETRTMALTKEILDANPDAQPVTQKEDDREFTSVPAPECVAFLSKTFSTEITAVLEASARYDAARMTEPGTEFIDLQRALYQIAYGPTDDAAQAKAFAASLSAARSALDALSKAEAWWEDADTKKTISDALEKLKDEL
jgi:hypothetical protein